MFYYYYNYYFTVTKKKKMKNTVSHSVVSVCIRELNPRPKTFGSRKRTRVG